MKKQRFAIYYQSRSRGSAALAERYQQVLCAVAEVELVAMIASSAERSADIQWLSQLADKIDEVYVIGGDGSVNIVAQVFAKTEIIVTVIPYGTGNDLARDLGIQNKLWALQAPQQLQQQSEVRKISLGLANDEYFVNHIGAGLTVDLMRLQPLWFKTIFGRFSYTLALLGYLFMPRRWRSHWQTDKGRLCAEIVAVSQHIGGGIAVNVNANRTVAQAHYLGVPEGSRVPMLGAFVAILRKRPAPYLVRANGSQFSIGGTGIRAELDGDVRLTGIIEISIVAAALTVRCPVSTDKTKRT